MSMIGFTLYYILWQSGLLDHTKYIVRRAFEYVRGTHTFNWFYSDYKKILEGLEIEKEK